MTRNKPNILFLSHGAGPLPLLGDPDHRDMVDKLTAQAGEIEPPSAILVISAHWEASVPTVTAAEQPSLLYDYAGFPPEAYHIRYPCPGHPALARQVHRALQQTGLNPRLDQERGLDHGTFVPLKLMYPDADIPCVQLSLVHTLDAATHLAIGRALRDLDVENLLVIGSGFSFHNMRAFFSPDTRDSRSRNEAFQAWLEETCSGPGLSSAERMARLTHWQQAPHARFCHPREEHLLPLHVCYGLAQRPADRSVYATILGKQSALYYWAVDDRDTA